MFCPSCGLEYAQKLNYCKRCGIELSLPSSGGEFKGRRPRLAGIFWAISVFGLCGIGLAFIVLLTLARLGVRGDEMLMPFGFSLMAVFGIAGLLVWQLSRLITASQQQLIHSANFERPAVKEYQPAQITAAPETAPSVIEHTTRQFGTPVYKEPGARE